VNRETPAADLASHFMERVEDRFAAAAETENAYAVAGWRTDQANGAFPVGSFSHAFIIGAAAKHRKVNRAPLLERKRNPTPIWKILGIAGTLPLRLLYTRFALR